MTQPQKQFEAQDLLKDAQTARSRVQNKSSAFISTLLLFLRHCWPFTKVHKNTWGRFKVQAEESSLVCWDQIWVVRAPHSAHHHRRTADTRNRTSRRSIMLCGCCKAEGKMKTQTITDPGGRSTWVYNRTITWERAYFFTNDLKTEKNRQRNELMKHRLAACDCDQR